MRASKPYVRIDPDVLERARQIDLLSYLRSYEPSNLVKVKGTTNVYCTAEHDSLKIRFGFLQESRVLRCIYLKPPLIYCPMPPI